MRTRWMTAAALGGAFVAMAMVGCGKRGEARTPDHIVTDLGGGVTMKLVRIEAGTFTMGSPASEKGRSDDETQHEVTISKPFYMGVTEVTQAQWEAVMGNNPSHFKGRDLPVETVSWNDCQEFIRKLNAKVPGRGFRLPTEAEWEYACRAGTKTAYQWGDDPDKGQGWCNGHDLTSKEENKFSWTHFNWRDGFAKTAPVGSFKANAWGLYDMHGNVWEWCEDWYGEYPRGRVTDPKGPADGRSRVLRGGSWFYSPQVLRSATRDRNTPEVRGTNVGFRVAVDVR